MAFKDFLLSEEGYLGRACEEAIDWLGDRTPTQTLAGCHRGDWLLWWAQKVGVDGRKLAGCAGHCANTVRHLMVESSIAAVDAAIGYGEGTVTDEELQAAYYAAIDATYSADRASYYVAAAAAAAAHAVYATYSAAAHAALTANHAASDKEANQRQTADTVRRMLGKEIIEHTKAFVK